MSYANERNALRTLHNALVDRQGNLVIRMNVAATQRVSNETLIEVATLAGACMAMKEVCAALRTAINELKD